MKGRENIWKVSVNMQDRRGTFQSRENNGGEQNVVVVVSTASIPFMLITGVRRLPQDTQ
jgi:hypothetical protein